jgi:hypothetical protein
LVCHPHMQNMVSNRVRVIDLETTGSRPPAHDVCEIGWQDVVQDGDGRWAVTVERGALLVNPGRPIPPVTMAVHHIIDADVAGAPFWKEVAPTVLKPEGGADRSGRAPSLVRAALLHPAAVGRRALDLHVEVRAAPVAGQSKFLKSGAAILAHAGGARP